MIKLRKTVDATKPLSFTIKPAHVKAGKCGDPNNCIVSQAIVSTLGDNCYLAAVGLTVTKVYKNNKVFRYKTPNKLKRAITEFDTTGVWNLPPGDFQLPTLPKALQMGAPRVVSKTTTTKKKRKTPTRKVNRALTTELY